MERVIVESTLTPADWSAYSGVIATRMRSSLGVLWVVMLLAAGALAVFAMQMLRDGQGLDLPSLLLGVGVVVVTLVVTATRMRRAMRPAADGAILGPRRTTLDATGVALERPHSQSMTRWTGVRDIELSTKYLFLWIDNNVACIVPLRDLPPDITAPALVDQLRAWRQAAASHEAAGSRDVAPAADITSAGVPPTSGANAPGRGARSRFTTLARLLTLRPVDINRLSTLDGWIAVVAAIAIGVWLALNRWDAGADAEVYPAGFVGIACCTLLAVLLAWIASRVTSPPVPYRSALLVIAAYLPAALLAYFAIDAVSASLSALGGLVLLLFGMLYLERYFRRLGAGQPILAVLFIAMATLAFSLTILQGIVYPQVWFESYESDAGADYAEAMWKGREQLLFAQPDRIDAEVARVRPHEEPGPNVFFVGFAGYAQQRVFAEEVKFAANVVGARYGSSERSVLLINDRRDEDSKPLATVSGLRRTLSGVAEKMNVEKDILFLYLSSHGAGEPLLTVSQGPLPLDQLTGESLFQALEDAGIRWRVIVISACYSGAFIDELKDNSTIILAAAAADRTSFGCSDDRELTYFGEALLRDSLPKAPSLRAAFDSAIAIIAAREKKEKAEPSQPDGYFGADIEPYWSQFEKTRLH